MKKLLITLLLLLPWLVQAGEENQCLCVDSENDAVWTDVDDDQVTLDTLTSDTTSFTLVLSDDATDMTLTASDGNLTITVDGKIIMGKPVTLPAGVATADGAPLFFNPGTLLTTPEAGAMEFDGTGIYLTPTNHRRFISLASDSIIATQTATTVAPTTLWTGITNADELKPNRVYLVKGCGLVNNFNAAQTTTVTVNFGGTAIVTLPTPLVKLTNDPWDFEIYITIRTTGVAGTVSGYGRGLVSTTIVNTTTESIVLDTTAANNITVDVAWAAAHADNWLKLTQCWLAAAD